MQANTAGDFVTLPSIVLLPDAVNQLNNSRKPNKVISIACGANHNLALTSQNEVYSWGYGEMLALGHGKDTDELLPKRLNFEGAKLGSAIKVTQVAGGGQHSALIGRVVSTA